MLGIVFTTLVDMLEESTSTDFVDEVLVEANFEHGGAYTAVGYYPFAEIQTLLTILSEKTGSSIDELLYTYGRYLFGKLVEGHPQVLTNTPSLLDLFDHLEDDIHVQVKKLYADADLPTFTVISREEKSILLHYHSTRELYALAEGLMDGAAEHFNTKIERTTRRLELPSTFEFVIRVVD